MPKLNEMMMMMNYQCVFWSPTIADIWESFILMFLDPFSWAPFMASWSESSIAEDMPNGQAGLFQELEKCRPIVLKKKTPSSA